MVLFAGIAAEALIYGEAEGGENDENLFRSISVLLEPPLSVAQVFLWLKLFACLVTLYFYNATFEFSNRCQIKQGGRYCNLIIF